MRMSVSRYLRVVVVFFSICSFGYFFGDEHPYIVPWTFFIFQIFCGILFTVAGRFSDKYPETNIIVFLLILFVQLRFIVLIFIPESFVGNADQENTAQTMLYIIFATIACFVGVKLGSDLVKKEVTGEALIKSSNLNINKIVVYSSRFLIFSTLVLLLSHLMGGYAGSTGSSEHLGFVRRYLIRLIDYIPLCIIVLVSYQFSTVGKIEKMVILFSFVFFVASFLLVGSRSGIFCVVLLLLSCQLAVSGNFLIKINFRSAILYLFIFIFSVITFPIATQLRGLQRHFGNLSLTALFEAASSIELGPEALRLLISEVSYRISYLEVTHSIVHTEELGYNDISDLVSAKTTVLSSINRMIPGKPLGNIFPTEFAYGFLFRSNGTVDESGSDRVDYVGTEWNMYGISHQLFGYRGSLVFICVFTAIFVFASKSFRVRQTLNGYFTAALFNYTIYNWVQNLGLDNFVDRTGHSFIIFALYIVGFDYIATENHKPKRTDDTKYVNESIKIESI